MAQPFGKQSTAVLIRIHQYNQKLFTAHAEHIVTAPGRAVENTGHLLQYVIASIMTMGIIN